MTSLGVDIGGSSVKAALLRGGVVVATAQSERYSRPSFAELGEAVKSAIVGLGAVSGVERVGLCAPGIVDPETGNVVAAVNVPGLVGHSPQDLLGAFKEGTVRVLTDAHAAAFDVWSSRPREGRMVALSLGTGVGACVLDDGQALVVTGRSPGHIGQMDVSFEGEDVPVGPDGGRGSLEAYVGLPALERRFGPHVAGAVEQLTADSVVLRAVARAIRIVHAIYRPDSIVLVGGVGIALKPVLGTLRAMVEKDLTRLARSGWTLECGQSPFHAAIGAARLGA